MATDIDNDLLTVTETAKLLKVSVVTLHRWLKQGRLPAYHLGPRHIRIRRSDLGKVLTPVVKKEEGGAMEEETGIETRTAFRRLTEDEIRQRLQALEEAREFSERVAERRGGKPFSPSWPLIRKAREERSRQI